MIVAFFGFGDGVRAESSLTGGTCLPLRAVLGVSDRRPSGIESLLPSFVPSRAVNN